MKRLYSILLAFCMIGTFGFMGAFSVSAVDSIYTDALITNTAVLEEYNLTHGGDGELFAELGCFDETETEPTYVVITGVVTGAKKGLSIPGINAGLIWKAKLSGNTAGEALIDCPEMVIAAGAEIVTDGLAIDGSVYVNGGIISAAEAIRSVGEGNSLCINGGVVTGDLYFSGDNGFSISGGTVTGSLIADNPNGDFYIRGGVVNAPSISVAGGFTIINSPYDENDTSGVQVNADNVEGLANCWISISSDAKINFEDKLTNCVKNGTVIGTVTLDRKRDVYGTLTIPEGAKLIVSDGVALTLVDGGQLVIDGTLVLPAAFDFSNWQGTVTGKNAGNLAGTWPKQIEPALKWYQKLWNWLKYYIFFGWIWMKP